MIDSLLIISIVAFAVFVQTASGFGIALVAMPLLTATASLQLAAPLVALVAMLARIAMLMRYREAISWGDVRGLVSGSVMGIIAGTLLLSLLTFDAASSTLVETGLGVFILGYALFELSGLRLPALTAYHWPYTLGFLGGMLARLYNAGGTPAVIYGHERHWSPNAFKENLQLYAMVNGVLVIAVRAAHGEFTATVMQTFLMTTPAVMIGLATGFLLDCYIDAVIFRRIVLFLLLFVGIRLVF